MARLQNILTPAVLLGLMASVLISCGDDDPVGYEPAGETISIVSNDLIFPAEGRTATLEVEAPGVLEASLSADWCTASVSGHVVMVTAQPNFDFDGRTALLTLKSGQVTRQLPVQQLGMVLDLPMTVEGLYVPREGGERTVTITHNVPITATSPQSWIHPEFDGNILHVRVDSNVGGHIRRGLVVCECGEYVDTLRLAQFDMMDDVVGSYYMMGYYGGNGGTAVATRFDIILRNDSLLMHWPQDSYANAYIHIPIDKSDCSLFIPSGFVLQNEPRNVVTGYFYDTNGTISGNPAVGVTARLFYSENAGYNSALPVLVNWPGHELGGFFLRSTSIVTTTLMQLGSPVLMRIGPVGTTLN